MTDDDRYVVVRVSDDDRPNAALVLDAPPVMATERPAGVWHYLRHGWSVDWRAGVAVAIIAMALAGLFAGGAVTSRLDRADADRSGLISRLDTALGKLDVAEGQLRGLGAVPGAPGASLVPPAESAATSAALEAVRAELAATRLAVTRLAARPAPAVAEVAMLRGRVAALESQLAAARAAPPIVVVPPPTVPAPACIEVAGVVAVCPG